jgi:hypothetical protein
MYEEVAWGILQTSQTMNGGEKAQSYRRPKTCRSHDCLLTQPKANNRLTLLL